LVDSDAARKCVAYTNTFQEEALVNPVTFEQSQISFIVYNSRVMRLDPDEDHAQETVQQRVGASDLRIRLRFNKFSRKVKLRRFASRMAILP
jgi:hypothetical protein